ncbi:hypothetical protein GC170_22580 [bacterium]|nr:hypothetical protein [bacterium]
MVAILSPHRATASADEPRFHPGFLSASSVSRCRTPPVSGAMIRPKSVRMVISVRIASAWCRDSTRIVSKGRWKSTRGSTVVTTSQPASAKAVTAASSIALPSASQEFGSSVPAIPPPLTCSWMKTVRRPGVVFSSVIMWAMCVEEWLSQAGRRIEETRTGMKVIPVMDLRKCACVHAKAGQRAEYRPLVSVLTPRAAEPLELAAAYHNRIGADAIYVADLDAIVDDKPAWNVLRALTKVGPAIWADVGVRSPARAVTAFEAGIDTVVLGLETLSGPASLKEIVRGSSLPRDRFLLSLDLFEGRPMLAAGGTWPRDTSLTNVVEIAAEVGLGRFLILDLARVGTGRGVAGEEWIDPVRRNVGNAEIWLGGGVRSKQDLDEIARQPIAGVLVGSALHEGAIGGQALTALARNGRRSPR